MALNAIFGVNGIGKDTVAECIRYRHPEITVTSMSRLLMYILGISKSYDVREKVGEEQYKSLESVPQRTMLEIENENYRFLLERISQSETNIIILAHLITALRHGNKVKYLTERQLPDWFLKLNEHLIQLIAPAEIISQRRYNDVNRSREADIGQILEHQDLCNQEWTRIGNMSQLVLRKMIVVENVDLEYCVKKVENVLF